MTKDEFKDLIERRRDFNFVYKDTRYQLSAKPSGSFTSELKISLGELYESPVEYESFKAMMASAKVGNSHLRSVLDCIEIY